MKDIIIKYLTDTITDLELEQLLEWIKKPKNVKEFEALVKEDYNLNLRYDNINEEMALQKIKHTIQNKEQPIKRLNTNVFKYAAAILILVSAGYFFLIKDNIVDDNNPTIVNNNIKVGTDKATLTLEDGTSVTLEKGKEFIADNLESNGDELIYETTKSSNPEIAYNYLTIPRGGQYFVKLSDGTEVWLNSETKIKYPVSFTKGALRKIELVYGEAYFDISPSTENDGAKFEVLHGTQEIQVLGTEFNVKAYNDESMVNTTLVEGKIAISAGDNKRLLEPGQQAALNTETGKMTVVPVDVYYDVAWKEGLFGFRKKPLSEIMKVLSRWYDIDVVFQNPDLKNVGFNGVLGKNQNIEDILKSIKEYDIIKEYRIENKTVYLK